MVRTRRARSRDWGVCLRSTTPVLLASASVPPASAAVVAANDSGTVCYCPLSGAKWKSKPPGEIALDRMVVGTVGELARIGDADLGLRGELQIAACFDQRGVARNRNTQEIQP